MAYCNKCGAYIPDGQTACLACGYDETAETKNSSASFSAAAAAAAQTFSDEVRKKVAEERQRIREEEEKRRIRQENERKWAEEEYKRRQQEKQAEEEYSYQHQRTSETQGSYTSTRSYKPESSAAQPNKLLAALSYLSILCFLPFLFCPNDDYAKFHAKQGIRLFILSLFSDIASLIPIVGAVFTLFRFYCIYKGMTNASAGKQEPLPYIGNIGRF